MLKERNLKEFNNDLSEIAMNSSDIKYSIEAISKLLRDAVLPEDTDQETVKGIREACAIASGADELSKKLFDKADQLATIGADGIKKDDE